MASLPRVDQEDRYRSVHTVCDDDACPATHAGARNEPHIRTTAGSGRHLPRSLILFCLRSPAAPHTPRQLSHLSGTRTRLCTRDSAHATHARDSYTRRRTRDLCARSTLGQARGSPHITPPLSLSLSADGSLEELDGRPGTRRRRMARRTAPRDHTLSPLCLNHPRSTTPLSLSLLPRRRLARQAA